MKSASNDSSVKSSSVSNQSNSSEGISGEAMSALSYFCGIVAIVALCVDPYKKDAKVRFNAFQALLMQGSMFIGFIALGIATTVISVILTFVLSALEMYGTLGAIMSVLPFITGIAMLGSLGLCIYLIVAAASGKAPRVPILSTYALKFANKQ